jgi:hypothetical protein
MILFAERRKRRIQKNSSVEEKQKEKVVKLVYTAADFVSDFMRQCQQK